MRKGVQVVAESGDYEIKEAIKDSYKDQDKEAIKDNHEGQMELEDTLSGLSRVTNSQDLVTSAQSNSAMEGIKSKGSTWKIKVRAANCNSPSGSEVESLNSKKRDGNLHLYDRNQTGKK